jgi:hypothetical protein
MACMTRRVLFAAAVLCAIFVGAALAADISGNWSGTLQAGNDPVPLTFTFKQDGEKLTGTVNSSQNPPLPLSDGKVSGDKISFFVTAEMNGAPTKFISEGVIKGDEITLNIKAEGGPDFGPTVLKRVK